MNEFVFDSKSRGLEAGVASVELEKIELPSELSPSFRVLKLFGQRWLYNRWSNWLFNVCGLKKFRLCFDLPCSACRRWRQVVANALNGWTYLIAEARGWDAFKTKLATASSILKLSLFRYLLKFQAHLPSLAKIWNLSLIDTEKNCYFESWIEALLDHFSKYK